MNSIADVQKRYPKHTFELIKKRGQGSFGQREDWYYCEKDENGKIVAYYHEWNHTNLATLKSDLGIKKYGSEETNPPF